MYTLIANKKLNYYISHMFYYNRLEPLQFI